MHFRKSTSARGTFSERNPKFVLQNIRKSFRRGRKKCPPVSSRSPARRRLAAGGGGTPAGAGGAGEREDTEDACPLHGGLKYLLIDNDNDIMIMIILIMIIIITIIIINYLARRWSGQEIAICPEPPLKIY